MLAELFMLRLEAVSRMSARMTEGGDNTRFVPIGPPSQNSSRGSIGTAPASSCQTATD
jgi:hypothetical protein